MESFTRDKVTLLHADCMEYMKDIPDNHFDLAIVDPPYGIGADNKNNGKNSDRHEETSKAKLNTYKKTDWDSNVPDRLYFTELIRVSKHQIIWGINYYRYDIFSAGRIVWDKEVTMPTYSDGEIAFCSKINSVKIYKFTWHGMIQGNMKNKEHRIHPTQKPIQLYKWLLKNYATPDMKILDTHLGSASSAIAAYYFGCEFVGMEIDQEYFDSAVKRFDHETRQQTLF